MIRKATEKDIESIGNIYDAIHTAEEKGELTIGWDRAIYPTRITAQTAIQCGEMFVMEEEGELVASARINQEQVEEYRLAQWQYAAEAEQVMVLHTLTVHPECSGKGYAKQFIAFYEDYARQHQCPYLRIDTNARNLVARNMYRKLAYQEVGIVPCQFNGIAGVQLVCLEKKL